VTDDAGDPGEPNEDTSRRRLLVLLGAAGLAVLGSGMGASDRLGGDGADDGGPSLTVAYSVTSDPATTPPTPTPTPTGGTGGSGGAPGRPPAAPPERDPTEANPNGGDDDDRFTTRSDGTDDSDPSTASLLADPVDAAVPPVTLSDVTPGDGGRVDIEVSLSGTPARLWARGAVTDADEGTVLEVERAAGDEGPPGELQAHVDVRLWYDDGGEERVAYEGPLAGLDAVSAWTPLTDACVAPGTHTVHLRWDLPADTPNVVQTDSVTFSLGVAADAGDCR
jgi:hypothetical protein